MNQEFEVSDEVAFQMGMRLIFYVLDCGIVGSIAISLLVPFVFQIPATLIWTLFCLLIIWDGDL